MTEHPNAAVVRRAYDAVARGDGAALAAMIAEDAVWHVPGRSPIAGEYRGRDAVLGFFARLRDLSGGSMRVVLQDAAGSDERGVALQQVTARRGGAALEATMGVAYRIAEGKLAQARYFVFDQRAYDEFWSCVDYSTHPRSGREFGPPSRAAPQTGHPGPWSGSDRAPAGLHAGADPRGGLAWPIHHLDGAIVRTHRHAAGAKGAGARGPRP